MFLEAGASRTTHILIEEVYQDTNRKQTTKSNSNARINMPNMFINHLFNIALITSATLLILPSALALHRLPNLTMALPCIDSTSDNNNTIAPSCTNHTINNTTTTKAFTNTKMTDQSQKDSEFLATSFSMDLSSFRTEYNKYKILSHLGFTTVAEGIPRERDRIRLREKLAESSAFKDFNNDSSSSSSIESSTSSPSSSSSIISSNSRHKRSLACNQVKSDKDACCMETLYVNFTDIGWDKWILYPTGYNANYCRGQCDLSHARYYHSTLLSKFSNTISLCCSPRQMSPLRLLYIDEDNKVHQKLIPDMIVESCDCA